MVVVALTFLMWLALRETFGSHRRLIERFITIPLYVFLALWSIGFGYGFWWSLIAGQDATRSGLAGLQEDARDASSAVAARLDAVRAQLDTVVTWSESQMAREESSGGSCGTTSGAGRGPLYNARRGVRDSVTTLRDGMISGWLNPVQADVDRLKQTGDVARPGTSARGNDSSRPGPHRSAARPAALPRAATSWANPQPQRCAPWQARWPLPPIRRGSPATIPRSPNGCEQLRGRPSVRPS